MSTSLLGSSNRNYLADDPLNRTSGTRRTLDAQIERGFTTGSLTHRLILAAEDERETFHARDTIYGGFTDQDRSRNHQGVTLEWRASSTAFTGDVAVRRDMFNRFADATSLRASALANVGGGFALTGSYAEGISQPTFFDLYGFFPGSFAGNPSLKPESSRGYEEGFPAKLPGRKPTFFDLYGFLPGSFAGNPSLKPESSRGYEVGVRYRRGQFEASLTGYRQQLHDEIVDVFDSVTFLLTTVNRPEKSHRSGIEAAAGWRVSDALRISANYSLLHATEPDPMTGGQVAELRRPKHSGSVAADGAVGRWVYGASIAYVGAHLDLADNFPFNVVRLRSYWLAGARLAYTLRPGMELYARASNLFGAHYEDSVGYHTEGRGLFAGVRLTGR